MMLETIKAYAGALKTAAGAIIIVMLIGIGWMAAADHYDKLIAAAQVAQADAVAKMQAQQLADAANHDKLIHDAGEQHAKDQLRINDLASQLNSVRIHFPSGSAVSKNGASAGNSDGACRMASARADEYMAEAQRAINDIGQRCAQLNADAIQANAINR